MSITTPGSTAPAFSYSQGIGFGDLVFIAGQGPRNPVTNEVPDRFDDQVHQTLSNLSAIAEAGGTSLAHALKVNVYLSDLSTIGAFDQIYRTYFHEPFPVRTTVQAGLRGYQVEIDAIVARPTQETL